MALICLIAFIGGCEKFSNSSDAGAEIELISSHSLSFPEPSGVGITANSQFLWIVSDNTNRVYKTTLSGEVVDELSYKGDNLEGITVNSTDGTLFVVEEQAMKVVHLDTTGKVLDRSSLSGYKNVDSDGLEGIACNPVTQDLMLLKEKNPGQLIRMDGALTVQSTRELGFADDFSGIAYDSANNCLWIVSDQSSLVACCTLAGELIEYYALHFEKAEGIACDAVNHRLYIVSESEQAIYVFRNPLE